MLRRHSGFLLSAAILAASGMTSFAADDEAPKEKPKPAKRAIRIQVKPAQIQPAQGRIKGFQAFTTVGGQRSVGGNILSLVRRPDVQKELKLTDDQKTKINEIVQESYKSLRGGFAALQGLTPEERQKKIAERQKKREKSTQDATKKIKAELNDTQAKRLQEIVIQQQGLRALTDKKTAKKLDLSDEQQQKIAGAFKWQGEERQKVFGALRGQKRNINDIRKKQEELQKQLEKKVTDILTDAQTEKFGKMKGEKFEFKNRALQIRRLQPGQKKKVVPKDA